MYDNTIKEWPIAKEDIYRYSNATEIFANLGLRMTVQWDISLAKLEKIEYITAEEAFRNIKRTLSHKKDIQDKLDDIQHQIELLKEKELRTKDLYWLIWEGHISKLEERYNTVRTKIDKTYKKSNTHVQLTKEKEEKLTAKRKEIYAELIKFLEHIREYF